MKSVEETGHNNKMANGCSCKRLKLTESLLRFAAFLCCVTALLTMATDKQTKSIEVPGFNGLSVTKTAKFTIAKAFVYLVSAAGIGAAYALLVLLALFVVKDRPKGGAKAAWFIFVFDQLVTYVLLAAASASAEVGYMGAHAPPELSWLKVCTLFGRFCNQLGASLVTAFIATVLFAFVSVISASFVFSTGDDGSEQQSYNSYPHKV